ncbi:unnamed protein product [Brassica rapa]|uniref:DUF4283 domain-containing protein n=1 Tax=Brassica campestris TaxID=3711 RepID=A0A3P6CPM3_BRACM|nr:unnamed protein product [Brassica rapa]VDD10282.1 unnamed protein product [Brassica rapa]
MPPGSLSDTHCLSNYFNDYVSPSQHILHPHGNPPLRMPYVSRNTIDIYKLHLHLHTPPEPSTPRDYDPAIVGNQLAALWPMLNDEILKNQPKGKYPSRTLQPPVEKLPTSELKADGSLRFLWAARLSPRSRNLYRAATPTYRLDGTPENKNEYIIGRFHKCSLPPGGLIYVVVNRIWGRSCKISCKKLGDSSFMFHIPHQPSRHWVIQQGVWHIDDCLLFVLPWTPKGSFNIPEISTLPVWANLKNVPDYCYSRLGISHVASGLGEPILTHKP